MASFKLRLVVYFVLLSLVPLAGATWAFSVAAKRNEIQRADTSLNKSVGAALGDLSILLDDAAAQAKALAKSPDVQRALSAGDVASLAAVAARVPGSAFYADNRLLAGSVPPVAASRSVNVVAEGRSIGRVTVAVALNGGFLQRVTTKAGLDADEQLLLTVDGAVRAGPASLLGKPVGPGLGDPADLRLGSVTYRAVSTVVPADNHSVSLLALTPREAINSTVTDLNLRLILAALGSIAIVAAVAFLPGRAIVASLRDLSRAASGIARGQLSQRVPVRGRDEFAKLSQAFNDMAEQLEARHHELTAERERVRRTLERLGSALTAGTEPGAILRILAEGALDATGAAGVAIIRDDEQVALARSEDKLGEPVAVPFGTDELAATETFLLYPIAGEHLSEDAIEAGRSLATQAAIALENARLHRILAQQAVTDDLTALANRRRFDEALSHEVSRVRRFGGPLALVIADLDDFKAINDRFGHQLGDHVLRLFADVLRDTVRIVDIAARPGGEEFAVILPGTSVEEASAVAERIRATFASRTLPVPEGPPISVTASFGVAAFIEDMSAEELFAAADGALYAAKAQGKNCVVATPGIARSAM
jgi:diguanylate cyclase (GGDEF)-like protein